MARRVDSVSSAEEDEADSNGRRSIPDVLSGDEEDGGSEGGREFDEARIEGEVSRRCRRYDRRGHLR